MHAANDARHDTRTPQVHDAPLSSTRYEQVVFMQGDEARTVLDHYEEEGVEWVSKYLIRWYDPGRHEVTDRTSAGLDDDVFIVGRQRLVVNTVIEYVGLEIELDAED